ncbi:DUF6048 family protein [Flavobacterium filum]|uniref:DUF6048 family protein n=1 Tax=Flavobacterium filum TaxID=370974 RepID=UPI000404CEDC|nr:DUF6048 family protein [Flavobacterium filum]
MMSISKCIFSVILICTFSFGKAQNSKSDSIPTPKTERYGLRVGVDAYRLVLSVINDNYKGLEFAGDYRISKNYYLAAEIGNENKTTNEDRLNYTTKGSYLKVGFDYNLYENWLDMENLIYLGLRVGSSTFSQELNSYKIYNQNPYFGEAPSTISDKKYNGLNAVWVEFLLGVKAEVISNFYAGFSFRMNYLMSNKEPNGFENLYIPGFNRTYSGKFGVGMNYTITYFIPIYKKKLTPKK